MKPPLRLVLDTNVVLSALLWEGRPAELLDLGASDDVRLFTSQTLLDELERSLGKPRLASRLSAIGLTARHHAANYASLAVIVIPTPLPARVSRDRDDDDVLACAIAAGAPPALAGSAKGDRPAHFRARPLPNLVALVPQAQLRLHPLPPFATPPPALRQARCLCRRPTAQSAPRRTPGSRVSSGRSARFCVR